MRACVRAGMGLCDRRRRRAAVCALPRVHRAERRPLRCLRLAAHSCRQGGRFESAVGRQAVTVWLPPSAVRCRSGVQCSGRHTAVARGCASGILGSVRRSGHCRTGSRLCDRLGPGLCFALLCFALLCFALLAPINEGTTSLRTALSRVTERSWKRTLLGFALRSDGEAAAQARRDVRPVGRQRRVDQEAVRCRSRAQRTHGADRSIDGLIAGESPAAEQYSRGTPQPSTLHYSIRPVHAGRLRSAINSSYS